MGTNSLIEQILSGDNLNAACPQVIRRRVEILKPDRRVRNLGVPAVTDRFIQQAIARVLTPVYEERFHDHSYGFRLNRCAQQAIIAAPDRMSDSYDWIVDTDLEKFLDTVNHDGLVTLMDETIKGGEVISIIRKFPTSGIRENDEYRESVIGTQRGDSLPPLLASVMRNELDKEIEQRGLNSVRYADNCINMVGSEMSAKRVMKNITRFIEEELGLEADTVRNKVDKPQGVKYLGYGFYFNNRAHQYKAKPHAKLAAKFKARMKQLTCQSWGVSNIYKVQELNELIREWIDYCKIGGMKTIYARLDRSIRYRIHMCIWKHWKTPQDRVRNLKKLGVPEWATRRMAYTKGYARVRGASDICEVVNNKKLASFGLVPMLDYYTKRYVTR